MIIIQQNYSQNEIISIHKILARNKGRKLLLLLYNKIIHKMKLLKYTRFQQDKGRKQLLLLLYNKNIHKMKLFQYTRF